MSWITSTFTKRGQTTQAKRERYLALLAGAAEREPSEKQAGEIAALAEDLKYTVDDVTYHAGLVAERVKLAPLAAIFDQLNNAATEAGRKLNRYVAQNQFVGHGPAQLDQLRPETKAVVIAATTEARSLKQQYKDACAKLAPVAEAKARLDAINKAEWKLFGLPDPIATAQAQRDAQAAEGRKRYLVFGLPPVDRKFDRPTDTVIGCLLADGPVAGIEYVTHPKQTPAELDRLLKIASDKLARFICNREDAAKLYGGDNGGWRQLLVTPESLGNRNPDQFTFYPLPGEQKQKDVDAILEPLREAYQKTDDKRPRMVNGRFVES